MGQLGGGQAGNSPQPRAGSGRNGINYAEEGEQGNGERDPLINHGGADLVQMRNALCKLHECRAVYTNYVQ